MKMTKDEWSGGVAPQTVQKVKSNKFPSAIPGEAKVACPKRTSQIALQTTFLSCCTQPK
jgi:hypothetical protein